MKEEKYKICFVTFSNINTAKMQRETFKVFLICKTPLHVPFYILK